MTRKTNHTLRVLVVTLLVVSASLAAFNKVGTTGAAFLKIGVGRATGMGDAFVAIADDPSASYYNVAGLSHVGRSIQFNHVDWIADVNHDYLAVVLPTGFGTLGFSVTALTMGEIEQTTLDDPDSRAREDEGTGLLFSASDFAAGVSYARIITDKLSFGFTGKVVQQSVWNMSAGAMGIDFGLHYNTGFRSLRIGATVQNFGTQLRYTGRELDYSFGWTDSGPSQLNGSYRTDGNPLPTVFRFGIAYDLIDASPSRLTVALDLAHPSDINEQINFGLEYGYNDLFYLRGGYVLNSDRDYASALGNLTGLSAGVGLKTKPSQTLSIGLDYSFGYREYVQPTHRVLLTLGF